MKRRARTKVKVQNRADVALLDFSTLHVKLGEDYWAELCNETARWSASAKKIRELLAAIERENPDALLEALGKSTLPARLRSQSHVVGKFLADREAKLPRSDGRLPWTMDYWCYAHGMATTKLQRMLERYKTDARFRERADGISHAWADARRSRAKKHTSD